MPEIFDSFIGGLNAGTEHRENRTRRNALQEAGRLYSSGEYDAAENALLGAGMPEAAANYTVLGEARRGRNNRQAATQAVTALGPDATPQQRMQAASGSYINNGEYEMGAQLDETISRMSQREREVASQNAQYLGQQSAQLRSIEDPMARVPAAYQAIEGTPYDTPQLRAEIERLAGADGITNADLDGFEQSLLTYQERLGLRREDEAIARQESQFSRSLSAQRAASGANGDRPLTNSERIRLSNDYQTNSEQAMNQLGILRPSLPYARLAVSLGGDTTQTQGINFRQSDVALMRAAARAQTGPGVLTESEVFSTLSPSLQQDLIRNVAYADISQSGLTPQDRASLAQFVVSSAQNVERDLWTLHRQASSEWGGVPNAPTFNLPNLPHPDDEGSLQAAERLSSNGQAVLQRGAIRIAPSGREYRYNGPGDWVTTGEGNVEGYQAGRAQRIARGGAPEVQTGAASGAASGGLPPPDQFTPGTVIRFNNQEYVLQNGQWVRRGQPTVSAPRSDGPMRRG